MNVRSLNPIPTHRYNLYALYPPHYLISISNLPELYHYSCYPRKVFNPMLAFHEQQTFDLKHGVLELSGSGLRYANTY
jgi:hypothetical protein